MRELENAGLSADHLPTLRKIVHENASRYTVQESQAIDISMLGEMIQATNAAAAGDKSLNKSSTPLSVGLESHISDKGNNSSSTVASVAVDKAVEKEEEEVISELEKFSLRQQEEDERRRLSETPSAHNRIMRTYPDLKPEVLAELKPFLGRDKAKMSPQEWKETVAKYYKEPVSALEKDRDEFFRSMEPAEVEQAEDEAELYAFHRVRTENEVILRARLQLQYDQKEAARRSADWKKRRLPGTVKKEPEEGVSRRKREKIPFEHRPAIKLNYPKRLR